MRGQLVRITRARSGGASELDLVSALSQPASTGKGGAHSTRQWSGALERLRGCRERPHCRRTAKQRDELSSSQPIKMHSLPL